MFSFYVKTNQVISIRPAHDTRLDTYPGKELSVPYNAECGCLCGSPVEAVSSGPGSVSLWSWRMGVRRTFQPGHRRPAAQSCRSERSTISQKGWGMVQWSGDTDEWPSHPGHRGRRNCPCIQGVNKISLWFLHYSEKVPTSAFSFLKAYKASRRYGHLNKVSPPVGTLVHNDILTGNFKDLW